MFPESHYLDISHHSLNKHGEELCGDKVEVFKSSDRMIVVLADGLGSGVKANILATLTTKIMITMLENGAGIHETIETIISTLPVCQVRKIGYSTFSILEIDDSMKCRIIEFDNPPVFVSRNHKLLELEKEELLIGGKKVKIAEMKLDIGDEITLCSDGVIHAGVGNILNHGWEWHHVAEFLISQRLPSAEKLNRRLIDTCNKLYGGKAGDDTTAVTVKVRKPERVQVFTGPPEDQKTDRIFVDTFMKSTGKKVVCGGTAANIFSRELGESIETDIEYIDPEVPPIAKIKGLDLVTEGVLTLRMVLGRLSEIEHTSAEPIFNKEDGVSKLMKVFYEESTHVDFWVGRAINPAHQNPDFPNELGIKINVVRDLVDQLRVLGKTVTIKYMIENQVGDGNA